METKSISTRTFEEDINQNNTIYRINLASSNMMLVFNLREITNANESPSILYEGIFQFSELVKQFTFLKKFKNEKEYVDFFSTCITNKNIKIKLLENNNISISFSYRNDQDVSSSGTSTPLKREKSINEIKIILLPKKIIENPIIDNNNTHSATNTAFFKISSLESENKRYVKIIEKLNKEIVLLKQKLMKTEGQNIQLKNKIKDIEEKRTIELERKKSDIEYLKSKVKELENFKNNYYNNDNKSKEMSEERKNYINNYIYKNQNFTFDIILPDEIKLLSDWIKTKNKFELIKVALCFKGTRDGDDTDLFFELCNERSPLILLVKTKKKKRFGAYLTVSVKNVDKERGYIYDKDHFMFSLDKQKKYPCINPDYAIRLNESYLFDFGYGSEMGINKNFFTKKGYEYEYKDSYKMKGLELSGEKWFEIAELEVYQVLSN